MDKKVFALTELIFPILLMLISILVKLRHGFLMTAVVDSLSVIALYYIFINVYFYFKHYSKKNI